MVESKALVEAIKPVEDFKIDNVMEVLPQNYQTRSKIQKSYWTEKKYDYCYVKTFS